MTLATSMPQSLGRVPLWLKLAYTAFMAMLVPVYLYYYGPTNSCISATSRCCSRWSASGSTARS
jgi:hypothetical protein